MKPTLSQVLADNPADICRDVESYNRDRGVPEVLIPNTLSGHKVVFLRSDKDDPRYWRLADYRVVSHLSGPSIWLVPVSDNGQPVIGSPVESPYDGL